jgi:hypothetical protein
LLYNSKAQYEAGEGEPDMVRVYQVIDGRQRYVGGLDYQPDLVPIDYSFDKVIGGSWVVDFRPEVV